MERIRRMGLLLLCVVLLCTGCSLDVESFLRPPRSRGAQQQVQQALETYIRDRGEGDRYTLKYPTAGQHTAAFVLCDGSGVPVEKESADAALAVAFYALSAAPEETHINLLRREGEQWVSVADVAGMTTDIRQVVFTDLNGDGNKELLTGWNTFNSREHRLRVYDMQEGLSLLADDRLYTDLFVGDLTADGTDSLLLLRVGAGKRVTASLERWEKDALRTVGMVSLDGRIGRFGGMTLCRLAQGVHGLYVEGVREDNSLITELICYDETGLRAPFYDAAANATEVTHRTNGLPARDVDGDGQVEVPDSRLLNDTTDTPLLTDYVTRWRAWHYETGTWSDRMQTVVNTTDGYMVILDEGRQDGLATTYDAETHTLDLTADGRLWLRLYCGDGEALPDAEQTRGMESLSLLPDEGGAATCAAWYDPQVLEAEKVRYMVCRLMQGG